MPYLACPNCGASANGGAGAPATCPSCCAAMHPPDELPSLAAATAAHRRRWPSAALRVPLEGNSLAPGTARSALRELQAEIGAEHYDAVELMVSELVTNAVLYGRDSGAADAADMRVRLCPDRVRVEVRDDGRGFKPAPRVPGQDDGSGWGLHLVEQLSDSWGVEGGARNCVWFEVGR